MLHALGIAPGQPICKTSAHRLSLRRPAGNLAMSAFTPIADICSAQANVCFVPKADLTGRVEYQRHLKGERVR